MPKRKAAAAAAAAAAPEAPADAEAAAEVAAEGQSDKIASDMEVHLKQSQQTLLQRHHQRKAKNHQRKNLSRRQRRPQNQVVDVADLRELQALKSQNPRGRNECISSSHWQLGETPEVATMSEQERKRLILCVDNILSVLDDGLELRPS